MNPKPYLEVPSSGQFDFIYGCYDLSQWRIPYFNTLMSLRQAASSLSLVNDFPGSESLAWKIDELYQRDIDWTRVERQIVPYLHSQAHPQFFNSLTVALLPILENQLVTSFDENHKWNPPQLRGDFEYLKKRGPFQLGYWQKWEKLEDPGAKLGQLSWNTTQVFSVAIDGQHRLAAIKEYAETKSKEEILDRTKIPVILIVLDPELGYKAPVGKSMVDVLRGMFIDLNKHAVPVSRSRLILLDDKDPHSFCVRALVGRQVADGKKDLEEMPPRLPLSLVDWHSDSAKFDEGPYIATILGLDWIVTAVIGSAPIRDYTDYRGIQKQIKALMGALGIDLSETLQRVKELEELKLQPFQYTGGDESEGSGNGELGKIENAFAKVWASPLIHLFTNLKPYENLVNTRHDMDTLSVEFVNWYYLYKRKEDEKYKGRASEEYENFMRRLTTRTFKPIGENKLIEKLEEIETAKGKSLAFKVVFQRALLQAFLEFSKIDETLFSSIENEDEEGDTFEEIADEETENIELSDIKTESRAQKVLKQMQVFVEGLNSLIEKNPDYLDPELRFSDGEGEHTFWLGSFVDPHGTIDFTLSASRRAKELIFWVPALSLCFRSFSDSMKSGFNEFWEKLLENELDEQIHKMMRRSAERFYKESGAGARILNSKEEDYNEENARKELERRLIWIWNKLKLPSEKSKLGKKRN